MRASVSVGGANVYGFGLAFILKLCYGESLISSFFVRETFLSYGDNLKCYPVDFALAVGDFRECVYFSGTNLSVSFVNPS